MTMFFSLLSLYAYVLLLHRKKYAAILIFIAATMLFHSQHIYVGVYFSAVLLHTVIFRRERLKILTAVTVITILVNAPWFVWLSGMNYANPLLRLRYPAISYDFIKGFLTDLFRYVFPLWLVGVVLLAGLVRRIRTGHFFAMNRPLCEKVAIPVFFIVINILAVTVTAPYPFFRYIAPTVPLVILLAAVIISAAAEAHWLLAAAAIMALAATSQLKDYFYEIIHDYDGPEEGIARYLNEHDSSDDIVAIMYGDMSLKFYTKMRVVGGLTGEDLAPAKNARWVILRQNVVSDKDRKVGDYLIDNIQWDRYRRIVIDYPDIMFENRESPGSHLFRTDKDEERIVIFERIE